MDLSKHIDRAAAILHQAGRLKLKKLPDKALAAEQIKKATGDSDALNKKFEEKRKAVLNALKARQKKSNRE